MNKKTLNPTISFLVLAFAAFMFPSTVVACRAPPPSPTTMVSRAEMIVRATAVEYVKAPVGDLRQLNEPGDAEIEFSVKEILKGETVPSTIVLNGYLTARDDFNDRPVPYDFVRPGGRGGSCSAYEYTQGAEFLLFLKKIDGRLTIRWYALAPTNEQLHSTDDPWVVWVKEQLKSPESKESSPSAVVFAVFVLWRNYFPFVGAIEQIVGRERRGLGGKGLSANRKDLAPPRQLRRGASFPHAELSQAEEASRRDPSGVWHSRASNNHPFDRVGISPRDSANQSAGCK